jgi:hypothetical protein
VLVILAESNLPMCRASTSTITHHITATTTMTSIAAGLNKVLPAPKHAAQDDGSAARPTSRILGNADVERQQLVLKVGFYLALTGRC